MAVLMLVVLGGTAFAESGKIGTEPGQIMPDFTVALTDGTAATLSELLKEKTWLCLIFLPPGADPAKWNFPTWRKSIRNTATGW